VTGGSSAVTATSAVVSGSVDSDGQPATYTFEVGVYNGASTQYGVVFSGQVASSTLPVLKTLPLTGLQPGVTYAYKVTIASGYGAMEGEPVTFTTAGLPSVLVSPTPLALLAVPDVAFPVTTVSTVGKTVRKAAPKKCAKGKRLSHNRCVKSKGKKKAKKASPLKAKR
jgi:hypothetical protein